MSAEQISDAIAGAMFRQGIDAREWLETIFEIGLLMEVTLENGELENKLVSYKGLEIKIYVMPKQ